MDLGYLLLIRRPRHRRRPSLYRRILAFDMDDEIFISLFHISKAMTSDIILLLNNALVRPTRRHNALPVGIQIVPMFTFKPHDEHWNAYLNRKGRYSLNIQMVCESNRKIIDVVAQYPGSVHDSFIYNNCGLRRFLHSAELPRNSWLLGDKGYPLEHCLLTPFRNPNNDMEERYNIAHRHTRNLIERVFGILKLVWSIFA
ncbi:hypothetical protein NQ314_021086 [Rhamnusium bicolor]|uniref:DDE Tnp4 domain-containing protein n=1 Tax=Rhamnusium bicolor TaxID=1586634 RepID=A0AAV8WJ27_9CUCU|nr:hypothetical protein NQ314_021086 [Rhamnusium bicolor]